MMNRNQRNIGKRIVAALLCAVMVAGGVEPAAQPVYAAEPALETESVYAAEPVLEAESVYAAHPMLAANSTEKTTFVTNNQKEDATVLSLRDGMLCVDSFPSGGDYTYMQIGFETGGKQVGENFDLSNPARPLPKEDGTYYVSVSLCGSSGASYSLPLVQRLEFTIKNGKASFVEPRGYDANQKLYSKHSTSKIMREYYKLPSQFVESDAKEIKSQAKKIVNAGDSDLEKIRKVHDWVSDNIWYDLDAYKDIASGVIGSVNVLKAKRTVCQGYADLTAALLRSLGIPTRVVSGFADGGSHAWNEAYADGRWIILDTTWDSKNRYKDGKFSEQESSGRRYFDPTLEYFSLSHIMDQSGEDYEKRFQEWELWSAFEVSPASVYMKKGETRQLKVKKTKWHNFIKLKDVKITYSSNNKKVATVNSKGKITAKKKGQAIITTKVKFEGLTLEYETYVSVWQLE